MIQCCVDASKLPIVEKLLANNADVGAQKKNKSDATFLAAQQGNLEILKLLLTKDPNYVDRKKGYEGRTPLGAAAMQGHLQVVQYLVNEWHVDIDSQDDYKYTALMYAAHYNHPTAVTFLLQKGASSTIKDVNGYDAMARAMQKKNTEVIKLLKDGQ